MLDFTWLVSDTIYSAMERFFLNESVLFAPDSLVLFLFRTIET